MSVPRIGIIGAGFVGSAIGEGFSHYTDVKIYDKNKEMGFDYKDVLQQDVLFICLPTPMLKNGNVDLSIIEGALERIARFLPINETKAILIKSTVPPGACKKFADQWGNLEIIFNPEFLTERTASLDFIQQRRVILGVGTEGNTANLLMVHDLYKARFPGTRVATYHWDQAALIKYGTNVFFSTKIAFFNELTQVARALGFNGDKIAAEILEDGRIGRSHWQVPGHDGKLGFGGSCFPKDLNGFMQFARSIGVDPTVSEAVWKKNLEVRPEKDWEGLKGRAVSEEDK